MDKKTFKTMREKDIVVNKVNGRAAEVRSVKNGVVTVAYLRDNGMTDADPETMDITEQNALCFRKVKDSDLPLPVPDASLTADGKLVVNGRNVECGQLRFQGILHRFPGYVVLLGQPDGAGTQCLVSYSVLKDEFKTEAFIMKGRTRAIMDKDTCGFMPDDLLLVYAEKRVESDDGTEIFQEAVLYQAFMSGSQLRFSEKEVDCPLGKLVDVINDFPGGAEDWLVFESTETASISRGPCRIKILQGSVVVTVFSLNPVEESYDLERRVTVTGSSVVRVNNTCDENLVVVTDQAIWFENKGHREREIVDADAAKAVQAYPYLVANYIGAHRIFLTFADDALRTATVYKQDSWDSKGYVVKVLYEASPDAIPEKK